MLTSLASFDYSGLVPRVRREILCKLQGGSTDAVRPTVAKRRHRDEQVSLISNVPQGVQPDDTFPSHTQIQLWSKDRDIAALRQTERQLLAKLTKCLQTLALQLSILDNGMVYDQWPTYGELQAQRAKIEATIKLIRDPMACFEGDGKPLEGSWTK